jgi:hypothetical protein
MAYRTKIEKLTTDPMTAVRKHNFDIAMKNFQDHLAKTQLTKKQMMDIKNKKSIKLPITHLVPTNKKISKTKKKSKKVKK